MSTIISENHDINNINWVAGLSDPGEMIRYNYLPQMRRQPGEQDKEYAARIRPIVMSLPKHEQEKIMGSAIKRAGLDTSNGRVNVMVAGREDPWHQLGVRVSEAVDAPTARKLSGLDFEVGKVPMLYQLGDATHSQEEVYGIVRKDTGRFLGAVGSRYQAIQNDEGFDFLDKVIGEFGARYETAGSLMGGKQVWMQVHLPKQSFSVGETSDRVEAYALFMNTHDGTGAAACYPTSSRVVCKNTLRIAGRDMGKGIRIRHTGEIKGKIAEAQRALHLAVTDFALFEEQAQALNRKPLVVEPYLTAVLDKSLDYTYEDAKLGAETLARIKLGNKATPENIEKMVKTIEKAIHRRKEMFNAMLESYESDRSPARGMAWACFNAVSEFADHKLHKFGRQVGTDKVRAERRFESVLTGDADFLKQNAYEIVLAMAV